MAVKSYKRKIISPPESGKQIASQWNLHKDGFCSTEKQENVCGTSSDESPEISWSSPSSSCSNSPRDLSRASHYRRHRVVTRLNFDDCVAAEPKVPRKKRAKVNRLFIKPELLSETENIKSGVEISENINPGSDKIQSFFSLRSMPINESKSIISESISDGAASISAKQSPTHSSEDLRKTEVVDQCFDSLNTENENLNIASQSLELKPSWDDNSVNQVILTSSGAECCSPVITPSRSYTYIKSPVLSSSKTLKRQSKKRESFVNFDEKNIGEHEAKDAFVNHSILNQTCEETPLDTSVSLISTVRSDNVLKSVNKLESSPVALQLSSLRMVTSPCDKLCTVGNCDSSEGFLELLSSPVLQKNCGGKRRDEVNSRQKKSKRNEINLDPQQSIASSPDSVRKLENFYSECSMTISVLGNHDYNIASNEVGDVSPPLGNMNRLCPKKVQQTEKSRTVLPQCTFVKQEVLTSCKENLANRTSVTETFAKKQLASINHFNPLLGVVVELTETSVPDKIKSLDNSNLVDISCMPDYGDTSQPVVEKSDGLCKYPLSDPDRNTETVNISCTNTSSNEIPTPEISFSSQRSSSKMCDPEVMMPCTFLKHTPDYTCSRVSIHNSQMSPVMGKHATEDIGLIEGVLGEDQNIIETSSSVLLTPVSNRTIGRSTSSDGGADDTTSPMLFSHPSGMKTVPWQTKGSTQKLPTSQIISQVPSPSVNTASSDKVEHQSSPNMDVAEAETPKHPQEVSTVRVDSGKKKKRVKKGGLAARLRYLLARRRSSVRMLHYQNSTGVNSHARHRGKQLTVAHVWTEFGHVVIRSHDSASVILACSNSEQQEENLDNMEEDSSELMVILDSTSPLPHLRPLSVIKIFPPWQTLRMSKMNITVVMCVSHVEHVSSGPALEFRSVLCEETGTLLEQKIFSCECQTGSRAQCHFRLPPEIFGLFFRPMWHQGDGSSISDLQTLWTKETSGNMAVSSVTGVLARNGVEIESEMELVVIVTHIFCFRQQNKKGSDEDNIIWSVLGHDKHGAFCEIILGCFSYNEDAELLPSNLDLQSKKFLDFVQGDALGKTYSFSGFALAKRIQSRRCSSLWALMKKKLSSTNGQGNAERESTNSLGADEQGASPPSRAIIHIFSPSSEDWTCMFVKNPSNKNALIPRFEKLAHILEKIPSEKLQRLSVLVKVVYVNEDSLYCLDVSMNKKSSDRWTNNYVTIKIQPVCVIPKQLMSRKCTVAYLSDLVFFKGELACDKYTRVLAVCEGITQARIIGFPVSLPIELAEKTKRLQAEIKGLSVSSKPLDLVTVSGNVVGIDEETAFSWPSCAKCNNDLLSETEDGSSYCVKCERVTETITKMSLEIFMSCSGVTEDKTLKIKLLQQSIIALLSPEPTASQSYDILAVLGKYIGPITCLLLKVKTIRSVKNYFLEEVVLS